MKQYIIHFFSWSLSTWKVAATYKQHGQYFPTSMTASKYQNLPTRKDPLVPQTLGRQCLFYLEKFASNVWSMHTPVDPGIAHYVQKFQTPFSNSPAEALLHFNTACTDTFNEPLRPTLLTNFLSFLCFYTSCALVFCSCLLSFTSVCWHFCRLYFTK